jgi:hypothetical protein
MTLNQLRGKLLEIICRKMLEDAGYTKIPPERNRVVYSKSKRIVEIYGRGTKHQIDLPYEFNYNVPFVNPIQVIGEVKYFSKPIEKKFIRNFIGVFDDIKDNYVVSGLKSVSHLKERRLTQALYISASTYQIESEKLAYAHNIKLISFAGNPVLTPVIRFIEDIINELISKHKLLINISDVDIDKIMDTYELKSNDYYKNQFKKVEDIFSKHVKSYFMGTTKTGYLMYFVSDKDFDFERLHSTDNSATISYFVDEQEVPYNVIVLRMGDNDFYSTLPTTIYEEFKNEHKLRGNAINSKYSHFSPITVYKKNPNGGIKIFQINFMKNN